jgi:hypothetical protein
MGRRTPIDEDPGINDLDEIAIPGDSPYDNHKTGPKAPRLKKYEAEHIESLDADIQIEDDSTGEDQEIIIKIESILDEPDESLSDEESADEPSDGISDKALPRRLADPICIFKGKTPEEVADKIAEKCRLKITDNKIVEILTVLRKLNFFISDLQENHKIVISKRSRQEKITIFTNYGLRNPKVKFRKKDKEIELSWWAYLHDLLALCYPGISAKRTLCNPIEFNQIILEELIVPLGPAPGRTKFWAWFRASNGALNLRMKNRMQELVNRRLKQD